MLLLALPCAAQTATGALTFTNVQFGERTTAELPRVTVDDSYPDTTGYVTKTVCASGCDFTTLSAAWTAATCSEIINMRAGQTFTGNTTLTGGKGCAANTQIIIRSDSGSCPAKGTRVTPRDFAAMALLVTSAANSPVIQTAADVGDLHIHIGPCLALTGTKGTSLTDALINLGGSDTASATQVGYVTLDRLYLYGPDQQMIYRRGVTLQGRYLALVDSWCENISDSGSDSQCTASFGGSGPLKISNDTLSGGAETNLFGGSRGNYASNPSDVQIFNNYVTKPSVWQRSASTYLGIHNPVKNSLEQKMGQRVHYKGNIIEYEWADAQAGWALVLTPRAAAGQGWPITAVQDITYEYNLLNKVDGGWNIVCSDDAETGTPFRAQRVNVSNNLLTNMVIQAMQVTCPSYFTYDHNSYLDLGLVAGTAGFAVLNVPGGYLTRYLKLTNNYSSAGNYTVSASGCTQTPHGVLDLCGGVASDYTMSRSAFVNISVNSTTDWPATNRFLADGTTTLFHATADYSDMTSATNCNLLILSGCVITNASPFHNAGLDAKDLGADIAGLTAAIANVRPTIPQITVGSISPTNGTHLGGTAVTITGTNFFTGGGLTMVILGGKANLDTGAECTSVIVVSSTSITCTTAAYSGTTGIATNVVVFNGGSYTSFSGYTFN